MAVVRLGCEAIVDCCDIITTANAGKPYGDFYGGYPEAVDAATGGRGQQGGAGPPGEAVLREPSELSDPPSATQAGMGLHRWHTHGDLCMRTSSSAFAG